MDEPSQHESSCVDNNVTNEKRDNASIREKELTEKSDNLQTAGNNVAVAVADDDDDDDTGPCGWGPLQLQFCQRFRRPLWFLVVVTLIGVCQGMAVNGFVNTAISTVERRFGISSTESGLIASCYDIMFVIIVIPVAYFGGQGNKPRYLAIGTLLLGIGSFIFCLPHLLSGKYEVGDSQETTCQHNTTRTNQDYCDRTRNPDLSYYKYYFYIGQLLHGAGGTTLYTLAPVYIDENVSQRSSSVYIAVFYTGATFGPALGYVMGGQFLKRYTDLDVDPDSIGLTVNNPRWVGAWWIGFLLTGTIGCLLSLPLLAFPKSLPGFKKYAAERGKETQTQKIKDKTGQGKSIKDVILSIRLLLCNIPYICVSLAGAADGILLTGVSTFIPKFIEYQYGTTAATAALLVGLAVVPVGGLATLLGGYLVTRFNLKVKGILRMSVVIAVLFIFSVLPYLIECETGAFAGVNKRYEITNSSSPDDVSKRLDSSCNAGCGCVEENYYPVCGRDDVMYFSPCHAGCTHVLDDGDTKYYSNCSCINYTLTSEDLSDGKTFMSEFGKCENSCQWLGPFLVCCAVSIILLFLISIPTLTATLRCIPEHQRSFGLGLQWIVVRCLGAIPGPILFGKMFDESCTLWQTKCDGSGSCFYYDNQDMRTYFTVVGIVFASIAAIFFFLAFWFYVPKVYEPTDDTVTVPANNSDKLTPIKLKQTTDSLPTLG